MTPTALVLADSARARLFEIRRRRGRGGALENAAVEIGDLVQPGRRNNAGENLSESRPGLRQARAPGGPGHAVDDHRDARVTEGDRRFAAAVVAAASAICSERSIERLLVVAPPRFVGHLRGRDIGSVCDDVDLITSNLSTLSAPQALEHLERSGYLDGG